MKFFIPIFFLFFLPINLYATVGGPIVFYDFKYNPIDESIYYTVLDYGGRGCPPFLEKFSLVNKEKETILSCNEAFSLLEDTGIEYDSVGWFEHADQKINEITEDFKKLQRINLNKNNITIDVNFLEDIYTEGFGEDIPFTSIYSVDIYQDGKIIDNKQINSCNREDEPFIFNGYTIPGFEKKIMLLGSYRPDCWENGYISDSIIVLEDVNSIDKDVSNLFYIKGSKSFLVFDEVPYDEGSLKVYESKYFQSEESRGYVIDTSATNSDSIKQEEKIVSTTSKDFFEQEPKEKNTNLILIITNIISLLLGLFFGRYIFSQSKTEK